MILSNCAICNSKESRFIKEQKASRLFSSLGIKMPLSQVLLLNPILSSGFKINKIIKEFLLGEDKLMPEMHVKQPGSTYSAWRPIYKKGYKKLTKQKKHDIFKTKKIKLAFNVIWLMEILKIYLKSISDKVLRVKALSIAKNLSYHGYQRGFASMVYKLIDKKTSDGALKSEVMSNEELVNELHKPIVRQFEKRKLYFSFKENIWGANLADKQLISKSNKEFLFLLQFIEIYSKFAWVGSMKDKKGVTIANAFQNILDESNLIINKYGWIKEVGVTTDQGNDDYKIML